MLQAPWYCHFFDAVVMSEGVGVEKPLIVMLMIVGREVEEEEALLWHVLVWAFVAQP